MFKQTTVFLHTGHMRQLKALAESQGIKTAQLLRIAVADYLRRNKQQKAGAA
jgi:16S rRNA U516 pseudouridylate synthase RsuA-like enzyme